MTLYMSSDGGVNHGFVATDAAEPADPAGHCATVCRQIYPDNYGGACKRFALDVHSERFIRCTPLFDDLGSKTTVFEVGVDTRVYSIEACP
jgi:hypothetical protein